MTGGPLPDGTMRTGGDGQRGATAGSDILVRMLDYDRWITVRTLEHCRRLTDEHLHQHFDIGWETVYITLAHIVTNMELWSDLLHGRTPRPSDDPRERTPPFDELIARHAAVADEIGTFARTKAARGELDSVVLDPFYDPPMEMTCGTVLCDIFHENMVHRSEVKHMLQRLGVPRIDAYDPISWEQALKARRDGDTVGDRGES